MAISEYAHRVLNDPERIRKRDLWFNRMSNVFHGTPDKWNEEHVYGVNGILGTSSYDLYTEPERWMEDCLEDLARRAEVLDNETYFRPLCVEFGAYGVHYVDKLLGAEVFFRDGQWYNRYLTTPIGELKYPDLEQHPFWQITKRAVKAFLDADVALPLFGLPTIASTLNISVNLYGEEILVEMLEDPDNAAKDLQTVNRLLCDLHRYFRSAIPVQQLQPVISWNRTQPPGYGQLCGCTTHLFSTGVYEEMVAPLDEELLSVYPNGGMIHLCGVHTQHMKTFRNMKALKAVQVNDRAAHDLAAYFEGLREDQVIYLNPCEGMTEDQAVAITGGKRLIIAADL